MSACSASRPRTRRRTTPAPRRTLISPANKESAALPGALGLADDPAARADHRYLWDVRGNLLHTRQRAAADGAQTTASGYAYDRHGRLLTPVRWQVDDQAPTDETVWRFAYDATQRRVLSQQGASARSRS